MKTFPSGLKNTVADILSSPNKQIALERFRHAYLSPGDTKWILSEYGSRFNMKIDELFEGIYKDVTRGKYRFDSEMDFIKNIIKEELLNENTTEEYMRLYSEYNPEHMLSSDENVYIRGSRLGSQIINTYNKLSIEDKQRAAVWWRDFILKQDRYVFGQRERIEQWNPVSQFDPGQFNGLIYSG